MLDALPTPSEMAQWDREAIRLGIPGFTLMENAAREALHVLEMEAGPLRGKKVLLFMGAGNNGGDAACLARHLQDCGASAIVVHTRPLGKARGDAGKHVRLARRCGVAFLSAREWMRTPDLLSPDIVADGLLGTGFSGTLRPLETALVEAINRLRSRAFVLALDIPSGLSGLMGTPCPIAVNAHATVTFEAPKPGVVLPAAQAFVGRLHVRQIGIPSSVRRAFPASLRLLGASSLRVLPSPESFAHKGRAGHVLIAGGSPQFAGAAHLAALGALRTGAGLVTVAAPEGFLDRIRGGRADFMSLPLPGNSWTPEALPTLLALLPRCTALAIGPGMGRSPEAAEVAARLLGAEHRPPAVIDADALVNLAAIDALSCVRPTDILTPHPGEAARLLKSSTADIQNNRFQALDALKRLAPAVWVLKGEGTLIGRFGQQPEPVAVCPCAEPNLAVGGSGDVLAGCAAALLAQGIEAFNAAQAAVMLHALAGKRLRETFPHRGNSASDIADALPGTIYPFPEEAAFFRINQ